MPSLNSVNYGFNHPLTKDASQCQSHLPGGLRDFHSLTCGRIGRILYGYHPETGSPKKKSCEPRLQESALERQRVKEVEKEQTIRKRTPKSAKP